MAKKALRLDTIVDFVFDDDPDKGNSEKESVFLLGAIPARVMAHLRDRHVKMSPGMGIREMTPNAALYDTVRFGLKGWRNYDSEFSTEELELGGRKYTVATDKALEGFTSDDLAEIANKLNRMNNLMEDEAKN